MRLMILLVAIFFSTACFAQKTSQENSKSAQSTDKKGAKGKGGEKPTFSKLLTEMDANQDGKLAKAEVKGPLKGNFTKVDANGDGFISESEFKSAQKAPSNGQQKQEEKQGEKQKEKQVEKQKDREEETEGEEKQQLQQDRGNGGERPTFAKLLTEMDANKDGKLAESEVKGPLKNNFTKVDANGDGFISESEFKNAPKPQKNGPRQ